MFPQILTFQQKINSYRYTVIYIYISTYLYIVVKYIFNVNENGYAHECIWGRSEEASRQASFIRAKSELLFFLAFGPYCGSILKDGKTSLHTIYKTFVENVFSHNSIEIYETEYRILFTQVYVSLFSCWDQKKSCISYIHMIESLLGFWEKMEVVAAP